MLLAFLTSCISYKLKYHNLYLLREYAKLSLDKSKKKHNTTVTKVTPVVAHPCSLIKTSFDLTFACLFDLMLYVHGKQLRSCWDAPLLYHTVPGQASRRQFASIKCPFFRKYRQLALLESAEEGMCWTRVSIVGHATDQATAPG